LVGQDAVVRTLRTALVSGKLAHAYLFSGPRGSGKTSAAKILARCIDCELGPTPEPDNTCDNCRAILAGSALDVLEIDAASNRGIDEIRALRESVKFAPASMRMKVFIIDEAHMLTREGANAFLKTLEEPPPHVCFILATTAPEALPPTILSRCQRYAFRRIPVSVMIARMREIADAERIEIDDGALGAIAYRADGGLRDALTMLEQVASYAGGAVDARAVDAAFGTTGREYASALCRAILDGAAATALRTVDEASDAGADMLGLVRGTIAEYRNLLVARIEPELLSRDLSSADAQSVVALAGATPQPKVVRGLRLLADALAAGRSSGNPRLELETAVLRLVVQGEDPSLEALATRVTLLEADVETVGLPASTSRPQALPAARNVAEPVTAPSLPKAVAPEPIPVVVPPSPLPEQASGVPPVPAEPAPAMPPPPATTTIQQVRSLWDQIRLRAEERHKPLRAPLSQATVDGLEGNALVIGVVDALQESIMRERTAIVEGAIADVVRVPLRVLFKPRAASARGVRAAPPERTAAPSGSASAAGGEIDLMSYARKKLGGTETT
jgi:DNA polymerase-3 subunit gamma/tau